MATLKSKAMALGMKAAERVMQNEKAMSAIAQTAMRAKAGKDALDRFGDGLLHAVGFAARGDYAVLRKRVRGFEKRLRAMSAKLDSID